MGRFLWRIGVVAAAAAAASAPVSPAWIERTYSQGWYPHAQRALTATSNVSPVAFLDVLVVIGVVLIALAVVSVARAGRGARWRMCGLRLSQAAVCGAVLLMAFLACWGLNYRREPLATRLDFDLARVTPEAVRALNATSVEAMSRLRVHLPSRLDAWPSRDDASRTLVPAFDAGVRALGLPDSVKPGRPKTSLLDAYFTRAGVSGMTDPFFLETLTASNLLPFERPMVVAHEWGHLAGLARESEASFFAWTVCLNGNEQAQYSAWLEAFVHTLRGFDRTERQAVVAALPAAVRADLRAMADRTARDEVRFVSMAAWRTYDTYLKANQVATGVMNYGEVLQLMVGTRFDRNWRPMLASSRPR
ncbi:MAG: DUF3810 family protein [Acidobacteria bacterium]|nr:DUF3810 family protein [Acidobacteriota bacterium]